MNTVSGGVSGGDGSAIPADALYRDVAQPVDTRVADLLSRMTLEEKLEQLIQNGKGILYADVRTTPEQVALSLSDAQKALRESRLGIPAIAACEALHGLMLHGCTVYPQSIALGATWNPALVKRVGAQIAAESAACGLTQVLAPVLDLGRDPRFGRIEECYSECPVLTASMGLAYITGLQGDNAQQGLAPDKVYGMTKHFAGYSVPANGINISPVLVGRHEMLTHHLIPFEAAVREAKVMAVMPSYNAVDGVPSHANRWLLDELLRKEWGFLGYVYSDWCGIDMLLGHRVATDMDEAGLQSFLCGVDVEAPSLQGFKNFAGFVRDGKMSAAAIDQAVARVLRAKFLAGLFDNRRTDGDAGRVKEVVHCAAHVQTAREVAEESIILLKNEGNLLPLDAGRIRSIALIGPNVAQVQFGDYSSSKRNADGVNVMQGLKNAFGDKIRINYAKGCLLVGGDRSGFAEAEKAADESDVAVVVIGDTSIILSGVGWEDPTLPADGTVGEGFDVNNPVPPGVQEELVKAIVAVGKPTIVVLLNGRPYCLPWMHEHVPAIIEAFYPGEQQGAAIVDILFGRVNPSGRLPVTLARSAGHIPCTYDYKGYGRGYYRKPGSPDAMGRDYVFDTPDPLWPFGFGLSYTTFAYSGLVIETPAVPACGGRLRYRFTVTNTGSRTGKVVAQTYWRDSVGEITPPEKRLLRFEKVELASGESRSVRGEVPVGEFRALTRDCRWHIPSRAIELQAGDNAEGGIVLRESFRITES